MRFSLSQALLIVLLVCLSVVLVFPQSLSAQDHVVSNSDIQKDLQEASAARQKKIAEVETFLSSETSQKALKSAHIDYRQVEKAVPQLSDDELASISARAEQAQRDFTGGSVSNRDLIWIILGVAVLVLVIVAVRG
jgi:dynactin complex subunit